jgi:squalene-hopene/tetraprenyl-beta-curcumene cyclase
MGNVPHEGGEESVSSVTAREQTQRRGGVSQLGYDSSALDEAIGTTQAYLLKQQATDGYWVGELESDVTVSAGYIPLMRFLHLSHPERERKIVNLLKGEQRPDGGWSSYRGGSSDLNVSAQAYFALKLAGVSPEEPFMQRARRFVLSQGGATKTHTFTKLLLAPLGQYDWRGLPSLPPEVIFLPNCFYINIYEFASWARETIVDLMVLLTTKPVESVPDTQGIWELYGVPREEIDWSLPRPRRRLSWHGFFLLADKLFKLYERLPWQPGRKRALQRVEEWIVEHQEADGSWGGIMLPWVYSLIALKSLGYSNDHPVMAKAIAGLEGFIVEDERTFHLQPAVSPVWDTALSIIALSDSGLEGKHPALVRAAEWLLDEQVLTGGDWQVKNRHTEPGGWAFEFHNDLYPDVDDSAVVPLALQRVETPHEEAKREAIDKARHWVLGMQSKNGGWAAFDKDNDKELLAHIPYADFMTPLDPTSVDVTAHVVELLAGLGDEASDGSLERALDYLRSEQDEDGSWYGRWGVNYVYGIGAVLPAFQEAGLDMGQPYVRRAVEWLKGHQNGDGGWGESCGTYDDPSVRGQGQSTPSQTAWALMALLAAGEGDSDGVRRGIDYLLSTQKVDGTWDEEQYTGTGFPRAFYLRYHMYRIYFPLLALGRYRGWLQQR